MNGRLLAALVALATAASAWAGDCPEGVARTATLQGLEPLLAGAERVAGEGDAPRLNLRMAPVRSEVGCLGELVTPRLAARYHRLRALQEDPLGLALERDDVLAPLVTARALDPEYEFGADALPADHPMRGAWDGLDPDALERARVRPPKSGTLVFDGIEGADRPSNGATVFQWVGADGQVLDTTWVAPGDPLPDYDPVASPRVPLLVVSGALAAGAVGLWAGSAVTESQLKDRDVARTRDEIDGMAARANAMFFSAIGVGIVAGGTATVALVAVKR